MLYPSLPVCLVWSHDIKQFHMVLIAVAYRSVWSFIILDTEWRLTLVDTMDALCGIYLYYYEEGPLTT